MKYGNLFKSMKRSRQSWKPRLRLGKTPIKVRLIPGEYPHPAGGQEPMLFVVNHYSPKTRKSTICSSRWKLIDDEYIRDPSSKCVGCEVHEASQGSKAAISSSPKSVVTVLVLEDFHLSNIGWDGKPLGVDNDGNLKLRKVICTHDAKCEGCKRKEKTVYGRRMVWEIAPTYGMTLLQAVESYQDVCAQCGSDGLELSAALCPQCGSELPTTSKGSDAVVCPFCKSAVTPVLEYECPNDCEDARPPTLFDMTFSVSATTEDKWQKLVVARAWVGPIPEKTIRKLKKAHGDNFDKLLEPLDLAQMYRPLSLHSQATILGVKNPYFKDAVQPYDTDDDDDSDEDGYSNDVPF